MSKKHTKNANYKTKTNTQPESSQSAHWLTIGLVSIVLVATIIGSIIIIKEMSGNNSFTPTIAPTVPIEENIAGNDTDDIAKYLKEKYNMEFTHEFTSAGASVFSSDNLPGLIQVFRREVVQSLDPSIAHLFTDAYADNGYMIVNMKRAATYYSKHLSGDFGNHTLLTYIDIVANPSEVTVNTPYEQYLQSIANLSIPELIILTDKILTDDEKATLDQDMQKLGTPVTVRVFTLDAAKQNQVTPSDIMPLGSGDTNVQYYKTFNANHLIGE